jgi:hypothetical protein
MNIYITEYDVTDPLNYKLIKQTIKPLTDKNVKPLKRIVYKRTSSPE